MLRQGSHGGSGDPAAPGGGTASAPRPADPGILQAWIGATDDGAIAVDADGLVVLHNPAASRVTGLSPETAIGRHWRDVLRLEPALNRDAWRVRDTGVPARLVTEVLCAQGNRRATEIMVTSWQDESKRAGILVIIRDLAVLCRQQTAVGGRSGFGNLIGAHPLMLALYDLIGLVSPSDAPVVIEGEPGTGKELVAQLIHAGSGRAQHPLIVFNCGSLEHGDLEGELFGHGRVPGRIEAARDGTLVIEEPALLPAASQSRLIEVLQSGSLRRMGESRPRAVDVRLLATSRRPLESEVKAGRMREELYYRLKVVRIAVPPLRERLSDLPRLVEHFVALHAADSGVTISAAALAMLTAYGWPGNVRELESAVRHALALRRRGRISRPAQLGPESFPAEVRQSEAHVPLVIGEPGQAERRMLLLRALAGHGGNRSAAARTLGIGRATFYRWWKDAGLGTFPGRA